jgi:DNA-binding MarR family transcriptional regulator
MTEYYDRILHRHGLTLSQYSILSNINKIEPCSVSDLAKKVRLERTTLVRNLKLLFAEQLITDDAKTGQRNRRIRLSSKGLQVMNAARHAWEEAQTNIERYLEPEELRHLKDMLLKIEKINERGNENELNK